MANKLSIEKKIVVISMLAEGSSIRAIERVTGVNRNTIMSLGVRVEAVPVHEVFRGKTVWQGTVQVFELSGRPKANRAYGWSYAEGPNNTGERFVTVLKIPPVTSPETAC